MAREIIKYHNNFIEAVYSINTIAKKLLIGISHKIQKLDKFGEEITFSPKEVCGIVGIGVESYRHLEKAVDKLMDTRITCRNPEDDKDWLKFQLLGESSYKKGILTVTVPRGMRPYLMELDKLFTVYHIENIKPLRSEYSIRIFELLKQYENTKQKKRIFKVEELRSLLGCTTTLKRYSSFKQRVIEVARKDLKEKCDIYFEYEEIYGGKKIVEIEFKIFKNKKNISSISPENIAPVLTQEAKERITVADETYMESKKTAKKNNFDISKYTEQLNSEAGLK